MDIFDIPVTKRAGATSAWPGLGWFTFEGRKQTFRLYVPKGIGVYGSRAKVK
jgi:hypothetical protein